VFIKWLKYTFGPFFVVFIQFDHHFRFVFN